ncbi:hypothetical protein LCS82_08120 [Vibrio harveyi]|uniref:hypothetical protein n=1 Tax=Vibrio harveyi TaxID=669 RepID=UPI003BB49595
MLKVSNITRKLAQLNNIKLVEDAKNNTLLFTVLNDSEQKPVIVWAVSPKNELVFKDAPGLSPEMKEELPHWVSDNNKLREVIRFVKPAFTA